ncbi:MAG TPA: DUF4382 domain-containing protein [Gemmatimonadales bacterium]|nr:DUF4382 domain-containing protein [Gemmatimonadales bacterium]
MKRLTCLVTIGGLVTGLSCKGATAPNPVSGNPPGGSSTARVMLTDAPASDAAIQKVIVYIDHIDASASTDSTTQSWVTLVSPRQRYDLLSLQNGTMALLGTATLPAAAIQEIRVALNTDSSGVFRSDGSAVNVHWGYQGAIMIHALVESPLQPSSSEAQIVLDFNVANSFSPDTLGGAGSLNFLPWIRATLTN